jgi:hypothetical protein
LKKTPRPDLAFILKIGRDVAEGLVAAHGQMLIHRDIKPDNIWIEPLPNNSGVRAKILDFGLARPQDEEQSLVTQEGAILGTPAYMAPEQGRGTDVDHRADLFSLGVVLYQMSTGKRPFTGRDTMAILTSLAIDTPPEPRSLNPELSPVLSDLIMRLLEKDPDKRIQRAMDVVDVLKRLQPESTVVVVATRQALQEPNPWANIDATGSGNAPQPAAVLTSSAMPVAEARQPDMAAPKRKRGLLLGAGVALAGLLVGAWFVFNKPKDNPPDDKEQLAKEKEEPKKKTAPPTEDYALFFGNANSRVRLPSLKFDAAGPFTIEGYFAISREATKKVVVLPWRRRRPVCCQRCRPDRYQSEITRGGRLRWTASPPLCERQTDGSEGLRQRKPSEHRQDGFSACQ